MIERAVFKYRVDIWTDKSDISHCRARAELEDGTQISLVAIDREGTLKFEYKDVDTNAYFYCRDDSADGEEIVYSIYRASLSPVNLDSPIAPSKEEVIWSSVFAALKRWPDDFYDSGPLERENIVRFA